MLLSCDRYISVIRAENNRQQVAVHDDCRNIFLARTNPNSGWSNNEYYNFFLPEECQITLAIDRFYYIDVHIFDSKLLKNAFTPCRVPFRGFCVF